jgi:hypothetical protein
LPAVNSYLVERYVPGLPEAAIRAGLARVQTACLELSMAGAEIRYLGSIFLPDEESCFCRFESCRADAVVEVNRRAQVPFARISAGVGLEPGHELGSPLGGAERNEVGI